MRTCGAQLAVDSEWPNYNLDPLLAGCQRVLDVMECERGWHDRVSKRRKIASFDRLRRFNVRARQNSFERGLPNGRQVRYPADLPHGVHGFCGNEP